MSHYAEDRTPFLAYQRELRANATLHGQTISLDRDYPPEFNLAASIVDLRLPHELEGFTMVILRRAELDRAVTKFPRFVIVSPRETVPAGCLSRETSLRSATVVDYGCNRLAAYVARRRSRHGAVGLGRAVRHGG
jgi:hypothetical protein